MNEARFRRVLDHIESHLGEDLSVERLSEAAALSKFHFHRLFTASFGITVHRYVQMMRMKRAAYRLAFRADHPVLEIALDAGFEGPEAFARAFRQIAGRSPSGFRKEPDWTPWQIACRPIAEARRSLMRKSHSPADVKIADFPDLYAEWLAQSGEELRDFPLFCQRVVFFPDVPAHEAVTDLFLPLR